MPPRTRRRLLVLAAIFALAAIGFFVATSPGLVMTDVNQIKAGMTRGEVELILGTPFHDRSIGPSSDHMLGWLASDGVIFVWINQDGVVTQKMSKEYQEWSDPWRFRWQSFCRRLGF